MPSDYALWLATAGRGGLPHNFLGYLLMKILSFFRRETLSTSVYTLPKTITAAGPHGSSTYIDPTKLPQREGHRPKLGQWLLPQRQVEERATAEMIAVGCGTVCGDHEG